MRNPLVATAVWLASLFANVKTVDRRGLAALVAATAGAASLGGSLSMVWIIIGAVVSITILAALAPTFFTAIADLVGAVVNGETNSSVANVLLAIFGLVLAVSLVVGFIMLALRSVPGGRRF